MPELPHLDVRRIDQSYRVVATLEDLEHTHHTPFSDRGAAWRLIRKIKKHLLTGHDLNLAHWDTETIEAIRS